MFGVLSKEVNERISKLLSSPSQYTWDDSHSIIINTTNGCMETLWTAVCKVDKTFQRGRRKGKKWDRVPTRELLEMAIKNSIYIKNSKQELN